jgi:hypothetical protein
MFSPACTEKNREVSLFVGKATGAQPDRVRGREGSWRRASSRGSSTPSAGRREWVGLAVIALPCLLYSMDQPTIAISPAL